MVEEDPTTASAARRPAAYVLADSGAGAKKDEAVSVVVNGDMGVGFASSAAA